MHTCAKNVPDVGDMRRFKIHSSLKFDEGAGQVKLLFQKGVQSVEDITGGTSELD